MNSAKFYTYALHFFLLMPFLMYIGYKGKNTPSVFFQLLLGIACIGFLYHGFNLYDKHTMRT